jgi:predicted O-linked N-acetylglucosamine transferase (SPINDLY family)
MLLKENGAHQEAVTAFEKALALKPEMAEAYLNLGNIYYELGLADKSRQWFERAQLLKPSDGLKIRSALSLPGFYDSQAQIEEARARLAADLERLLTEELRVDDPIEEIGLTPFFLAYQGKNDVWLLSLIADLLLKACPALGFSAPHCAEPLPDVGARRIELGFISSYFGREHIVNRSVSGVIAKIPRDRFRVTILHLDGPCDEIRNTLQAGDQLVKVPYPLPEARERIAAEKLDILFYTDLGLEPWSYFLSFARLARVQCTSGGHPVTSGVPNMDYYLSAALDEIEQAQAHYRERLVRLPDRAVCYYPAAVPELPRTRADFGLSDERRMYFCPMTPFKLHPATDELFGKLLRADPEGEIVFVLNHQVELWQRLQARFARTIPDVAARLRFLPHQPMPEFVALLRMADVLLDTPAFNGGTTSFEALAVGTPIITLPGEFYRQRVTFGLYKWMDMFDCVARDVDDYVRLALEIAQQPERRAALKQQILARNHVLFGQDAGILEAAQFLLSVMEGKQ